MSLSNLLQKQPNITISVTSEELCAFGEHLIRIMLKEQKEKKVLTNKEVAEMSGYSINTINHKVSKREIPYYKQGGRVFFHRDEIEEWLLSNMRETLDEYVNKQMERRNS